MPSMFTTLKYTTTVIMTITSSATQVVGFGSESADSKAVRNHVRSREAIEDTSQCVGKGFFSFPDTTYEEAKSTCYLRDRGTLHLYSFSLTCENADSPNFKSWFSDALCVKDCTTDESTLKIKEHLDTKYSKCSADVIEISVDANVGKCMDETRQIGSGTGLLTIEHDMTYTIESDTVTYSDDDISDFTDECKEQNGQIITSSFTEKIAMNPDSFKCKFTDILDQGAKAKVTNWPRCFGSSCSPHLIRKLLTSPENPPSKWHCDRDIYSLALSKDDFDETMFAGSDYNESTMEDVSGKDPNGGHSIRADWTVYAIVFIITLSMFM